MDLQDWISDDFLGRLNPKSEGTFVGRDDNDNGILFLAMMLMLDFHQEYSQLVQDSIKRLQVEPGVYNRRSISPDIMEAHDNYVGICALSVLYGFKFPEDIVRYGEKTGYNYNNVEPGKFELRCQRQGGDIAFYKLCAGYKAEPWYVVWMVGGLIVSAFRSSPSEMNLGWLRFATLSRLAISERFPRAMIAIGQLVTFAIMAIKRKNQKWAFANYFRPDHPMNKMSSVVQ